jgi:hypothetical protein
MTSRCVWCGVLTVALSVALATRSKAQGIGPAPDGKQIVPKGAIVGAVVAAIAIVAVIVIVAVHYSKKRTVTGCVNTGPNGMTVTDEKDSKVYALSGNTVGITPGDRVKLHGKKIKSRGPGNTQQDRWEAGSVAKDFGVCQP